MHLNDAVEGKGNAFINAGNPPLCQGRIAFAWARQCDTVAGRIEGGQLTLSIVHERTNLNEWQHP